MAEIGDTSRPGENAVKLSCRCGEVRGIVSRAAPASVNRVICYCDDCQAFAAWLQRPDLLDNRGGSDIVQVAPNTVEFTQGTDRIAAIRLTAGGLHRFYARCCRTPVANVVGPGIPFVGIHAAAFRCDGQDPDLAFGPPVGAIKGEYAIGGAPKGTKGIPVGLLLRAISKVLYWRISGRAWPHPFVERTTGRVCYDVQVLSLEERERLRPRSEGRPTAG